MRRLAALVVFYAHPRSTFAAFAPPLPLERRASAMSSSKLPSALTASSSVSGDGDGGSDEITVAVIGGGIAGLSCARSLSRSRSSSSSSSSPKFRPTVFDTGRLRPGGRCSSRLPGDESKNSKRDSRGTVLGNVVIDHAAQILTVPGGGRNDDGGGEFEEFREQVGRWEDEGVVRRFSDGSVGEILHDERTAKKKKEGDYDDDDAGGDKSGKPFYVRKVNSGKNSRAMYYGVNGMGSIPAAIARVDVIDGEDDDGGAEPFELRQDVWVSPNNGVKYVGGPHEPKWKVSVNGRDLGTYDRLVIAHNGKCADRLMSRTPAKRLHSLLRTNFAPTVPQWGGKRMTLNSIYSFTFAIKADSSPLADALDDDDLICAFVRNHPNLRMIICQTRKHKQRHGGGGGRRGGGAEVWTVLSSPKFAKKYKAPQENILTETAETVMELLLKSVEESLNMKLGALDRDSLLDTKLQLWGAAVPLNVWEPTMEGADDDGEEPGSSGGSKKGSSATALGASGFLYDAENGVGAVGDWLLDPSIGGAWESGRRLAEWMLTTEGSREMKGVSVGLPPDGAFRANRAAFQAGIGNVR